MQKITKNQYWFAPFVHFFAKTGIMEHKAKHILQAMVIGEFTIIKITAYTRSFHISEAKDDILLVSVFLCLWMNFHSSFRTWAASTVWWISFIAVVTTIQHLMSPVLLVKHWKLKLSRQLWKNQLTKHVMIYIIELQITRLKE